MIRALLVDDETLVRKGLRLVLPWEKHGIEIAGEAASAKQALLHMASNPVELLITDITMPGMSGLELIAEVRERYPAMQSVILTCHQDFDYIQEALRLGALDYIVKTQLEGLDVDETLGRIVKRMSEWAASAPTSPRNTAAFPAEDSFKETEWIIHDGKYAAVRAALTAKPALYPLCRSAWQSKLWCAPVWGGLPAVADAEALDEIRRSLRKWLYASHYSEEVLLSVLQAIDLIHALPLPDVSQAEVCKRVALSKSYFSKCFRDIIGVTFTQYVQEISFREAKRLLMETNRNIYVIAEQCGFADEKYFSKAFRERTGMLPSEYRQKGESHL